MNFFDRFIFTPQPKMWFVKPKWLKAVIRVFGTLIWLVYPFLCFLMMEYINFSTSDVHVKNDTGIKMITKLFDKRVSVIVLDLIILYLISALLVLVFKRLWVSCAVLGLGSFGLSVASFFKYQLTGEYMYPWDFQQTGNLDILTEYLNIHIPEEFYWILGGVVLLTVIVALTKTVLPIRWNIRIPAAIITVLVLFATYGNTSAAVQLASRHGMSFSNGGLQETTNYSANGFIGGFTLNVLASAVTEPEGYSESAVNDIFDKYEGSNEADGFRNPNVILILQESFWDVRDLPGLVISENPYNRFDEITSREGVYSGRFATTGFGGGTVKPEFEVLTGLTTDHLPSGSVPYQYVTSDLEAFPALYKSLGYHTMSIHPYLPNFYMRQSRYPLIGFEETYFIDELKKIEDVPMWINGGNVSDFSFEKYIEYFIEETDDPLFLFGISMEGHQPYDKKFTEEELKVRVDCDTYDEDLRNLVNQYTHCMRNADGALGRLIDYVDSSEEDTVIVFFGDHAPTLGSDKAAYRYTGLADSSGFYKENLKTVFTTPFLIYANFDLEESTMLNEGKDNVISSYCLMSAAGELIGAPQTKLTEFLKDYQASAPGYNSKMRMRLTKDQKYYRDSHMMITYDRLFGKNYSVSE